jgi:2',3'-cyclic-nucleotide 2'-phosphodiesterase (5'-nucleotidase family)
MGKGSNAVKVGVLGLAGEEIPEVTLIGTTEGLVFKDLTETILHYQEEILAQADALIVVAHMGTNDSGPYDGLKTVAQKLIDAGSPVDLMIGGHQHQPLFEPVMVGDTAIVSAGFYGRWLGQLDLSIDKATQRISVMDYQLITVTGGDLNVESLIGALEQMYADGLITNAGVYNSLMKKLEGAQDALAKGNAKAAENMLEAFANELAAQAGKKIDADAAAMILETVEGYVASTDLAVQARVAY